MTKSRKRKRVSARMVAEMAGVSLTTVSHVLNNKQPYVNQFSEETKRRILECARKLNYRPNLMAAGLKSGRSHLFALILRDVWTMPELRWAASGYDGQLISGVNAEAVERGLFPVIGLHHEEDPEQQVSVSETLIQVGVDGLIVKSPTPDMEKRLESLTEEGTPFVVIYPQRPPTYGPNWIDVDNLLCGEVAAECLVREGCKRILYVVKDTDEHLTRGRHQGYVNVLTRHGLEPMRPDILRIEANSLAGDEPERFGKRLQEERVDGILAGSGGAGVCIIREMEDIGIRIPSEIKMVAHDCRYWQEGEIASITSVEASWFEAGQQAVARLAALVEDPDAEFEPITLKPQVYPGGTCSSVVDEYAVWPVKPLKKT